MRFEPRMLAAMDQAGDNGICEKHIEAAAAEILRTGLTETDKETFNAACRRCGINPGNFTTEDLDEPQYMLNR